MLKVPLAGEDHCDFVLVGGGDDFIVFFRASRLYNRGDAGLGGVFYVVREGEEGIRGHGTAFGFLAGVFEGDQAGLNAIHLAGPDSPDLFVFNQHDGVALGVLCDEPGDP